MKYSLRYTRSGIPVLVPKKPSRFRAWLRGHFAIERVPVGPVESALLRRLSDTRSRRWCALLSPRRRPAGPRDGPFPMEVMVAKGDQRKVTGARLPGSTPTSDQYASHKSWGQAEQPEPIDEAGSPIPVPASWRRRSAELYRDLGCPRASACADVARRRKWPQYGCHGCEHASDDELLEPPPPKRRRYCVRKGCRARIAAQRAGEFCSEACEVAAGVRRM